MLLVTYAFSRNRRENKNDFSHFPKWKWNAIKMFFQGFYIERKNFSIFFAIFKLGLVREWCKIIEWNVIEIKESRETVWKYVKAVKLLLTYPKLMLHHLRIFPTKNLLISHSRYHVSLKSQEANSSDETEIKQFSLKHFASLMFFFPHIWDILQ